MSDSKTNVRAGGERQCDRDAFNRLNKRFVDGGMSPEKAREKAREVAQRNEHRVTRR